MNRPNATNRDAPLPRSAILVIALLVFTVFLVAGSFAATTVVKVLLAIVGAALGAGSYLLLTGLNMPRAIQAIDVEALIGADATLKEAAENVDEVLGRIDGALASDTPRGIGAHAGALRATAASMAELVRTREFAEDAPDEDHRLVFSLATAWLPGAWNSLANNVRYLTFGGKAAGKASGNLGEIEQQCAMVEGALDRIRANIVEGATDRVETGSDYLRQRLGGTSEMLSV